MKLFVFPGTRSDRPQWLLEELGVPYERVIINLTKGEQRNPEYLKCHPLGKVPLLEDNGSYIFESGGICAYLADKFLEKKFAPAFDSPSRGKYYQWLFYCVASIEPVAIEIINQTQFLSESERSVTILNDAREIFFERAAVIDKVLQKHPFLLGTEISAADILVGGTLLWDRKTLTDLPAVSEYLTRLTGRPAFEKIKIQKELYRDKK